MIKYTVWCSDRETGEVVRFVFDDVFEGDEFIAMTRLEVTGKEVVEVDSQKVCEVEG
ncbi:hypothetical protein NVP1064O_58 [Vibrio phage 1.064.O._10N.261.52.E2]|nr:hypothetical protein NVP1064O_58 [Vibrio phage 1.064.O._10N.261.52.E2]AUR88124.1 hypothetical protein NVP1108O_58 [Vibrio phage 1.108.O._10N.222.51.A4]AUR93097.1 hypothetical protein NVP1182O_55 [Vibrio phage 1.182.O._10N.286.46.E1]